MYTVADPVLSPQYSYIDLALSPTRSAEKVCIVYIVYVRMHVWGGGQL